MRHVNRYCNSGHDVITPVALVTALRSMGGVPNSIAELVDINRTAIDNLSDKYEHEASVLKQLRQHFQTSYDCDSGKFKAYKYSNFGNVVEYNLTEEEVTEPDANEDDEESDEEDMEEDYISEGNKPIIDNESDEDIDEEIIDILSTDDDSRQVGDLTACIIYTGEIATKK